jgi:hypothetical protein
VQAVSLHPFFLTYNGIRNHHPRAEYKYRDTSLRNNAALVDVCLDEAAQVGMLMVMSISIGSYDEPEFQR